MGKSSEEVVADLEAVAKEAPAADTGETGEETTPVAKAAEESQVVDKGKGQTVPYPRFQEVIGQKNDLQEQLQTAIGEKTEAISSLGKLSDQLTGAKENEELLQAIRDLKHDDRPGVSDAVDLIDKALRQEIEAVEEDTTLSPEQKADHKSKILEARTEKLADEIAEARAEQIIDRADLIGEKWIDSLPEEYTPKDREVVARLWSSQIDWNKIEENPDVLDAELETGFREAINQYGTPRGSFIDPETVELVDKETTTDAPTPEEELEKVLSEKQYGTMTEAKDSKGKTVFNPEISDDDFKKDMAQAMRAANRARRA